MTWTTQIPNYNSCLDPVKSDIKETKKKDEER